MAWRASSLALVLIILGSSTVVAGPIPRITGLGEGNAVAHNGSWSCTAQPFYVEATQVSVDRAILHFEWASVAPPCGLHNGGSIAIGTLFWSTGGSPPVWLEFACRGSFDSGLDCGSVQVGARGAMGGKTSLFYYGTSHTFGGLFESL